MNFILPYTMMPLNGALSPGATALAWANRVIAAGGTVSAPQQARVQTLLTALSQAGIFLDRLWLHAAENTQQATIDIITGAVALQVNSPTFTVNKGFAGNGTSSYLDSQFNWQPAAGHFQQNSNCFGLWVDAGPLNGMPLAHENGAYSRLILGGATRGGDDMASTGSAGYTPANVTGVFQAQRGSPTQAQNFGTGGLLEQTNATNSITIGVRNFYILANNYPTGNPGQFSQCRVSATWMGGYQTLQNNQALAIALANYLASINGFTLTNPETAVWVMSVINLGGTVSAAQAARVDTLVGAIKAVGAYNLLDRLWLYASENATQALTDVIYGAGATAVNSPTFTANQGYNPVAGSYINHNYFPNAAGNDLQQNSASYGDYCRTSRTSNASLAHLGTYAGGGSLVFWPKYADGSLYPALNGSGSFKINGPADIQGMWVATRQAAATIDLYQNSQVFGAALAEVSQSVPTLVAYGLAYNNNGTLNQVCVGDQISVQFYGGGLTLAQAVAVSNAVIAYMGSISGLAATVNPEAMTWALRVIGKGGTVSNAQLGYVDALITTMKSSGAWGTLDRLWLFACENATQALTDLIGGYAATAVNSPVFTAGRGYQGNGTSSYIDSNYNATTWPNAKFTQNNAGNGIWIETAPTNSGFDMCNNFSSYSMIGVHANGANYRWAINSQTNTEPTGPFAGADTGLFHAERTGVNADAFYRNMNLLFSGTTSSTPPLNQDHGILSNLGALWSNSRAASAHIGSSMTPAQKTGFQSAMRTYMTAQGVA